jgi:hypothetical protein
VLLHTLQQVACYTRVQHRMVFIGKYVGIAFFRHGSLRFYNTSLLFYKTENAAPTHYKRYLHVG